MRRPLVLCILDGWGLAPPGPGNAISLAALKHIPNYWSSFPHGQLVASGSGVGLPAGEDGNTETGHINIGAGQVVYQDLPRINMAIQDGSFFKNNAFIGAVSYAIKHQSSIHLVGLLSDSGVHASRDHLYALLQLVKKNQCNCPVYLHLFTDGRDSSPKAGLRFVREIEAMLQHIGIGKIATIMGRYYGMDRDHRWERTEKAYQALTEIIPNQAASAEKAVEQSYAHNITDEFLDPVIITENGMPLPRIAAHDSVIFYNYRIDRPRQLTRAFIIPDFEKHPTGGSFDPYAVKYHHKHLVEEIIRPPFTRRIILPELFFVTMTEYERNLPAVVAFPLRPVPNTIGQVFADAGVRQLRVAETEKERFIGYYFNGMREDPFAGEDRLIIPSPRVATYDLQPEMSIRELTAKILDRVTSDAYGFVAINFANPDMVAHTGNIPASVRACEIVDESIGMIVKYIVSIGGACIITADHGNVEEMLGTNGEMDTEHSTFPVPFMVIDERFQGYPTMLPAGKLADVAPTILHLAHIQPPSTMTGKNLLADLEIGGRPA